jgi:hypothetical protein
MCDYSLHSVATRSARIEDKLVTTKFKKSITRGFAAVGEPHVAVCLLPGTEIVFDENVECEPSFGIGIFPNKKIEQRLARFRQINPDNPVIHHDALEFPDGSGGAAHAPVCRPACHSAPIARSRSPRSQAAGDGGGLTELVVHRRRTPLLILRLNGEPPATVGGSFNWAHTSLANTPPPA